MGRLRKIYRNIFFRLFGRKSKHEGWTLFAPLKIIPEYIVDLEKGKVTGLIKHDKELYLTVVVDVRRGKTDVTGSLRSIYKYTLPFKEKDYIEMIEREADSLLESNWSNK